MPATPSGDLSPMRIANDGYSVDYAPETGTVTFTGVLRAPADEYKPIMELVAQAAEASPLLTLDLRRLTALNSSGITALARFILSLRLRPEVAARILASRQIAWQPKSLANFKLLLSSLILEWDG